MNCSDLTDFYELYALGLLEDPERTELEEHLSRNCEICTKEVGRAAQQNAAVLMVASKREPPSKLRNRVLAGFGIDARPLWLRLAPWGLAAVAAALIFLAVLPNVRKTPTSTPHDTDASVIEWLNTPGVRQFSFGKEESGPRGSVLLSRERGVMLTVANLPTAPTGKMYEAWIVPKSGTPQPSGQLAASNGIHTRVISGPLDPSLIKAVAVSLEQAGSTPQAPATVVFAAPASE